MAGLPVGGFGVGEAPWQRPQRPQTAEESIGLWLGVGASPVGGLPVGGSGVGGSPAKLVSVFCENNSDFRLAMRADGVVMTRANPDDPHQQWIKIDMGHKFVDDGEFPAFILINKASGQALAHGYKSRDPVTPQVGNGLDGTILWSQNTAIGREFAAVRVLTNPKLNLNADNGNHAVGEGVKEGTRLSISTWTQQENQYWKIVELTNFQQSSTNPDPQVVDI